MYILIKCRIIWHFIWVFTVEYQGLKDYVLMLMGTSVKALISFFTITGSGKTTLLNVISGRLKPDSGDVILNGSNFNKRGRRRMAFVQQQDVFFSHLTVWETLYVSHLMFVVTCTSAYSRLITSV